MSLFNYINGLITKAEARVLQKAAHILIGSEKHDQYFFEQLQIQSGQTGSVVKLGQQYSVVRTDEVATKRVNTIMEVR